MYIYPRQVDLHDQSGAWCARIPADQAQRRLQSGELAIYRTAAAKVLALRYKPTTSRDAVHKGKTGWLADSYLIREEF